MILQALHGYYERRMRDPDPARRLPVTGLEEKEIPFVLELARDGRLVAVGDLFICAGAVAGRGETGWLPIWQCPNR